LSESTYPVVVGVDGSFTAIRAARWAAAVAESFAAPLLIVHASPSLSRNPFDAIAGVGAAEMAAERQSAEAVLASAEHAVRGYSRTFALPPPKRTTPPTRR
jgi:nucleotide-binding universal stress UspA family protein